MRDFAFRADREVAGARWSYKRDIGRTRIVMMDSRAGRVLEPGARSMVDAEEWDCIEEWTRGDFDHLLLGTSLPVFLGRGMHYLEAWNEAVCDGAWGAAGLARRPSACARASTSSTGRRSATRCARSRACSSDIASGRHGGAPGSVVLLSGDVHHAYIADARPADGQPAWQAPVYQAVCSPLRNPLDAHERRAIKLGDDARRRARRARRWPAPRAWRTSR